MAAFMEVSGVYARMGYFPSRESLRPRLRASAFLHVTFQDLPSSTFQILDSPAGQRQTGSHFNDTLAKTSVDGFTKRGGDAAMR